MPEHPILTAAKTLPLFQLEAVINAKILDALHAAENGQAGARRTVLWAELLAIHREAQLLIAARDETARTAKVPALEIPPLNVTLTPTPGSLPGLAPRAPREKIVLHMPGRPAAAAAAPVAQASSPAVPQASSLPTTLHMPARPRRNWDCTCGATNTAAETHCVVCSGFRQECEAMESISA